MKKLFKRRKRKQQSPAPPALYSFPRDIEKVKEEASTIAGFIVILQHWPDKTIQSRLLLEMAASYNCERQQEFCRERALLLCNDLATYREAFIQSFADAYESMVAALQNDPTLHAKYMESFGHMTIAQAVQTVLSYPDTEKKEEVSNGR